MINIAQVLPRIPHADQQAAVRRLDAEGDTLLSILAAMKAGDANAGDTVRAAAEVLKQLAMVDQVFPFDLRAAWGCLNQASMRLLGEARHGPCSPDTPMVRRPQMKHWWISAGGK